jgi:hypothetical protein
MATDVGEFAYSQRVYGQMDEWQKAEWHRNMGQYDQAKMYQIAAASKDTANIALQSVQAAAAFAVESEPGLVPPPWRGEIFWSEAARKSREMELFAPLAGMAREQAMKRTAEAAAAEVRTSAAVQENIARSQQRALQQAQQQSWSQARQEEYAQAEFKQREKFARTWQRFEAEKENRERLRQAKLKLIAAIGPIAQGALTSLAKGGVALGQSIQADKAEADAADMSLPEYRDYTKGLTMGATAGRLERRSVALEADPSSKALEQKKENLRERQRKLVSGAIDRGVAPEYLAEKGFVPRADISETMPFTPAQPLSTPMTPVPSPYQLPEFQTLTAPAPPAVGTTSAGQWTSLDQRLMSGLSVTP